MEDKLVNLEYMLDLDSQDPIGLNENLLPLHFQISQLEAFRNEATHMAKKLSPDVRNTLKEYFTRLNRLLDAFDAHILELARNILPLVRGGHTDVVVKLIKIAEFELKEDEKVNDALFLERVMLTPAIGSCDQGTQNSSQDGRGIQVSIYASERSCLEILSTKNHANHSGVHQVDIRAAPRRCSGGYNAVRRDSG